MKGKAPPKDPFVEKRAAALKALKEYTEQTAYSDARGSVIDVLIDESDRGAIMLVQGVLEDLLADQIIKKLPGGRQRRAELLKRGGVLNSTQDKITMGAALNIIDEPTADSLDIIRQLRNACAHSTVPVTLTIPSINAVLGLMLDDDHAEFIKTSKNENYLRFVLALLMSYHAERIMGKTQAEAQAVVDRLATTTKAAVDDEAARLAASREKRSRRPDPDDPRNQKG